MAPLGINKAQVRSWINKDRARGSSRRFIDSLPPEVISEIVGRVGAASAVDLFRCKQTCKKLHEITDEKWVLRHAAIEGLYASKWESGCVINCLYSYQWRNKNKKSFFYKCCDSNNPQALYYIGMVQYFSQTMVDEGLKNLEKAAALRHKDAIYVLSLVLMCSGDNERMAKGGRQLLELMEMVKGEGILELRREFKNWMYAFLWRRPWNIVKVMVRPKTTCPSGRLHEIKSNCGLWGSSIKDDHYDEEIEDNVVCGACKCDREVAFFWKTLPLQFTSDIGL